MRDHGESSNLLGVEHKQVGFLLLSSMTTTPQTVAFPFAQSQPNALAKGIANAQGKELSGS